jgi:hypothetical protein
LLYINLRHYAEPLLFLHGFVRLDSPYFREVVNGF